MSYAFGIESRKSLPRSNMFYPLYYPRYTIVLDFTFRSMTNFELCGSLCLYWAYLDNLK